MDTPETQDFGHLTPSLLTDRTHTNMNLAILDEGSVREVTPRDVAWSECQFDVVMIGPCEAPQFGKGGHLPDLTRIVASARAYDGEGIIPPIRNALSYRASSTRRPCVGVVVPAVLARAS